MEHYSPRFCKVMQVTIGISPGTRHMGIAILNRKQLISWRVLTFKGKWSPIKLKLISESLSKIYSSYEIESISVKVPDRFPTGISYSQLLGVINSLCERFSIRPEYYSLSEIKAHFSSNDKVNKATLVARLVSLFPELLRDFRKEQQKRTRYYVKVFEAVAVAYIG